MGVTLGKRLGPAGAPGVAAPSTHWQQSTVHGANSNTLLEGSAPQTSRLKKSRGLEPRKWGQRTPTLYHAPVSVPYGPLECSSAPAALGGATSTSSSPGEIFPEPRSLSLRPCSCPSTAPSRLRTEPALFTACGSQTCALALADLQPLPCSLSQIWQTLWHLFSSAPLRLQAMSHSATSWPFLPAQLLAPTFERGL